MTRFRRPDSWEDPPEDPPEHEPDEDDFVEPDIDDGPIIDRDCDYWNRIT